jgi:hypothetical protein
MGVALHGNLRDFGIGEVFQLIGQQRKTGILEIAASAERIQIAFEQGAVVSAAPAGPYEGAALGDMLVRVGLLTTEELVALEAALAESDVGFAGLVLERTSVAPGELEETEDLLTRDTVFALLRWRQGSFHFTAQPVATRRDASRMLPAEQILMDGLRMVDEWRSFDPDATCDTSVFRRTGRFEAYREAHAHESSSRLAVAERLFLLIDGRLTVRRVIDLSRLGLFEGARILSQLRHAAVVEPVDPEDLAFRRGGVAERALDSSRPALRLLAMLLPFVFLAAMASLASREAAPPPAAGERLFALDPAERVERAAEAWRLRHLVEAHRFARSRWPSSLEDLADLAQQQPLVPAPLAAPPERPYYYAWRGDSFVLLPPPH